MVKSTKPIIKKIEIDENTREPIIIEVEGQEALENLPEEKKEQILDKEYERALGKQIVMKQVLGLDKKTQEKSKEGRLKKLVVVVFILSVLAVLIYTAYKDFFVNPEPISFELLKDTVVDNWYYFVFALIATVLVVVLKGFKLSVLSKYMVKKWNFKTCMQTGLIGQYYNDVTPLGAGGQPFEVYHLSKHGLSGGVAASLPIGAYFMYQFASVTFGIFALIAFIPSNNFLDIPTRIIGSSTAEYIRPLAGIGLFFGLALPVLVIVCSILPKLCSKLVYLIVFILAKLKIVKNKEVTMFKTLKSVLVNSKSLKTMGKRPLILITTYLISLLEILALCSISYFTLKFFGFDDTSTLNVKEWLQIIIVCQLLYQAISFIPTPGNSGAADISFYWLFSANTTFAFPAMILWRLLSYYSYVIFGFAFTTANRKIERKRKKRQSESLQTK